MWHGDYLYLIQNLVLKDFRIRYRNMSLGVLWSLLNPLVMMGVMTFVWTQIFKDGRPHFPLFVLCGMVPYNFFSIAWSGGTTSIVDNTGLIKRLPVPREVVPVSTVLSCSIHLLVQLGLLLAIAIGSHVSINKYWFWLPVVWGLEIVFVSGLSLLTASANVFVRDTRYVVESTNLVMMWLVPVFYDFSKIPQRYSDIYQWNPLAALVIVMRRIVYEGVSPNGAAATMDPRAWWQIGTMWNLVLASFTVFFVGLIIFRRMKPMFYEHI
jgi:ABC-type polysaccharide/polyol phosphate export permease